MLGESLQYSANYQEVKNKSKQNNTLQYLAPEIQYMSESNQIYKKFLDCKEERLEYDYLLKIVKILGNSDKENIRKNYSFFDLDNFSITKSYYNKPGNILIAKDQLCKILTQISITAFNLIVICSEKLERDVHKSSRDYLFYLIRFDNKFCLRDKWLIKTKNDPRLVLQNPRFLEKILPLTTTSFSNLAKLDKSYPSNLKVLILKLVKEEDKISFVPIFIQAPSCTFHKKLSLILDSSITNNIGAGEPGCQFRLFSRFALLVRWSMKLSIILKKKQIKFKPINLLKDLFLYEEMEINSSEKKEDTLNILVMWNTKIIKDSLFELSSKEVNTSIMIFQKKFNKFFYRNLKLFTTKPEKIIEDQKSSDSLKPFKLISILPDRSKDLARVYSNYHTDYFNLTIVAFENDKIKLFDKIKSPILPNFNKKAIEAIISIIRKNSRKRLKEEYYLIDPNFDIQMNIYNDTYVPSLAVSDYFYLTPDYHDCQFIREILIESEIELFSDNEYFYLGGFKNDVVIFALSKSHVNNLFGLLKEKLEERSNCLNSEPLVQIRKKIEKRIKKKFCVKFILKIR